MAKVRRAAHAIAHACVFTFTIHVWHIVASDHFVGALYDVTLDHSLIHLERLAGSAK